MKTLQGIEDYLHITHYFDLKALFASCIQYLCSVIPQLITEKEKEHPMPPVSPSFTEDNEESIQTWKCVHTIKLLFKVVLLYQTSIEEVYSYYYYYTIIGMEKYYRFYLLVR